MIRRIVILVIVLGAIGAGVYFALRPSTEPIVLTGIVTTDEVIVSSQVQGRLEKLYAVQGNEVKKGQLLAEIDPQEWQADRAYYGHTEEEAATQVARLEAELKFEEEQTTSQIAQAKANLAAATAQVAQAEADLENATLTFQHETEAFKRGAESQQTFDQARTTFEASKAKVETAKKQKDAAEAAVNVAEANVAMITSRREALNAQKHQVEAAGAQKEKSQVQLDYTKIVAPIDGIVDVRAARQGEVVNPGQAIVTLIDPDNLWVRADVEETYIDRIHVGETMKVRLPSGREYEGTVIYRAVDADYATQRDVSRFKRDIKTFEVRLKCDNSDRSLAVGMTAFVTLPVSQAGPVASTTAATGERR